MLKLHMHNAVFSAVRLLQSGECDDSIQGGAEDHIQGPAYYRSCDMSAWNGWARVDRCIGWPN